MPGLMKGGILQSRVEYLRKQRGDAAVQRVMATLPLGDREVLPQILAMGWYPWDMGERLDNAIAKEVGRGDQVFLEMGVYSADHNLGNAHRVFVKKRDPHGLLRHSTTIFRLYYDTGRREYERVSDTEAVLRTFECETFSAPDCLTVVGWHERAIELCGGENAKVVERRCRARGDDVCEYACTWTLPP